MATVHWRTRWAPGKAPKDPDAMRHGSVQVREGKFKVDGSWTMVWGSRGRRWSRPLRIPGPPCWLCGRPTRQSGRPCRNRCPVQKTADTSAMSRMLLNIIEKTVTPTPAETTRILAGIDEHLGLTSDR